jgi:hypothetical protein
MNMRRFAAVTYAVVTVGIVGFQMALALGFPWGALAMGGAYPGVFPAVLRVAAVVQAGLLAVLALVVLACAGVALPAWSRASRVLIWFVVAFSAMSLVLNLITPSAGERAIWAPVAAVMLAASVTVGVASRRTQPAGRVR